MTQAVAERVTKASIAIAARPEAALPIFIATSPNTVAVRAGVALLMDRRRVELDATELDIVEPYIPGDDLVVLLGPNDVPYAGVWRGNEDPSLLLGGFHFALGGNATARAGGDETPAINPLSIWDIGFRPSCPDPRAMAYVAGVRGSEGVEPFWVDLYLLNVDHLAKGTSCAGATIADGYKHRPIVAAGEPVSKLDYTTAVAIMMGHRKGLLSTAEFAAAAYGVTEISACGSKPAVTGLDALRTSGCGMMQATDNLSIWGHDGDPDKPRASIFGGSWVDGDWAGSRGAHVGTWPDNSAGWIGARGRSDHLKT